MSISWFKLTPISKRDVRLFVARLFGDGAVMSWNAKQEYSQNEAGILAETNQTRIILATWPDYGNLGDQAIAYAEYLYLTGQVSCPVVILYGALRKQWKALSKQIHSGDIICLQGGGSLGTLYECYENERLAIIDKFLDNRIILFPQTFSYGESEYECRYLRHMQAVYNRHPDLHLIAREEMSYARMKDCFPNADVILTPDIALSLPPVYCAKSDRQGVVLCLRTDKERKIATDASNKIGEVASKKYKTVIHTDTVYNDRTLTPDEGMSEVEKKIVELAHARLVVTDRIHGMIFSALAGTPCIALDNSNGKVGQEYKWLKDLSYVHFAQNVDEAIAMIGEINLEPGQFPMPDFMPLFHPIASLLQGRHYGQI